MGYYDDIFECDKFDDCGLCKFRFKERVCKRCDAGEEFEPEDMEEVDAHFQGRF